MASLCKKCSTVISICIVICIATANGKETHEWTHDFGTSIFLQDSTFLTSPGQVYGYCDDTSNVRVQNKKYEQSCKFAIETTEPIDSPNHVRFCNFSLNADIPNDNEMYIIREISAITKDRAVLSFRGLESYLIFVLNFSNCTVSNFHINEYPMHLQAPTNERFDVIVTRGHKAPKKKFRTILDTDGNVISKEQVWFEQDSDILAVVDSLTKHRLVVDQIKHFIDKTSQAAVRIYTASNNGSIEMLKEYPVDEKTNIIISEGIITSATLNLLTVCSRLNLTLTCSQFDLNGNIKFETKVSLEDYPSIHSLKLENLPRGGFVLFRTGCRKVGIAECFLKENSFDVKKVDAAGKVVGNLKFENKPDGNYGGEWHVFENEKNELCISDVHSKDYHDTITLNVICFKDDEITGKITWPTS